MSTPFFTEHAVNPKFQHISTEEMVQELLDRKQAHVAQLSAMVSLLTGPAEVRPLPNHEPRPRAVLALPPAPKSVAALPPQSPAGASLTERIIDVLLHANGHGLRNQELVERLVAAGWITKSKKKGKLVASTTSEMAAKKALKKRNGRVSLPSTAQETPGAAQSPKKTAAPKQPTAPKAPGTPKKATASKAKTKTRPPKGQQVADFVLSALTKEPSKPAEIITRMKRAGWTSTAKNAEKMVENAVRKLVKKKKAKALGGRTFQAVG